MDVLDIHLTKKLISQNTEKCSDLTVGKMWQFTERKQIVKMNELFVLRKGEKTASKDSIIKIKDSTLY